MMKIDVAHARVNGVTCVNGKSSYFLKYDEVIEDSFINEEKYLDMSPTQLSMYRRLMKGLAAYTAEELCGFDEVSYARISRDHHKASMIVYNMKMKVFAEPCLKLIKAIFPKTYKNWVSKEEGEIMLKGVNFRKHGITERVICNAFIEAGLLPNDFFDLKQI